MKASVVRWQMVTPEPRAAGDFYHALFGWAVRQDNALGYREIASGGIGGGIWPAPQGVPGFVQLFIEVPDVAGAVAAALELGAATIVPRSVLPDGDVMAVLRDPTGIAFGLVTTAANKTDR